MKNPYYILWAEAFCRYKNSHKDDKSWAFKVFQMYTFINGINLATLIIWLRILDIWIPPKFEINVFPGTLLDKVFEFFILFWLPCIIINYFLIMRKKRYNFIINKYEKYQNKYAVYYGFGSILLGFATIMTYGFLTNFST
jgi:hypothetical protein